MTSSPPHWGSKTFWTTPKRQKNCELPFLHLHLQHSSGSPQAPIHTTAYRPTITRPLLMCMTSPCLASFMSRWVTLQGKDPVVWLLITDFLFPVYLSDCFLKIVFFHDGNGTLEANPVLNLLLLHSTCNLWRIVQTELVSAYIWQQQALEGAPFRGKTVVL